MTASIGVVVPVGPGREANLGEVLKCLDAQTVEPALIVVVRDGSESPTIEAAYGRPSDGMMSITAAKHEPGREQPRNIGVRSLANLTAASHVWFLDSDVVVKPDCLEQLVRAIEAGPRERIVVAPYDWLAPGNRPPLWPPDVDINNPREVEMADPRWAMFRASPPERVYTEDLSAGLACFSGNLVWPISEFRRVGGFWSELHHGRCEDGELGVRAVAMGVPISFCAAARGWHLQHPVNLSLAFERNRRDVPMLDARHPWIQGSDVFMVDRDGKAFDVRCRGCGDAVQTIAWWAHAEGCAGMEIPVAAQHEFCPKCKADDDQHCQHWWDGLECCWCAAPGMTEEQMRAQGMLD